MNNYCKNNNLQHFDIVIVGGGIIGLSFALSIAQQNFKILLIDSIYLNNKHININHYNYNKIPDIQVSSISGLSIQLMKTIGIWKDIKNNFCTSYSRLEIWENINSKIIFDSNNFNISELGFIVENRILKLFLLKKINTYSNITIESPRWIDSMMYEKNKWKLILNSKKNISCNLIIGADGMNSWVRKQSSIKTTGWKYPQSCLTIIVKLYNSNKKNIVWQIFNTSGPIAYLPIYDKWAILILYNTPNYIQNLSLLSAQDFHKKIITIFPKQLGKIKIYKYAIFPLYCIYSHKYIQPGLVLIGDAAHTIHPLAGQGLNMGLRDVKYLSEILIHYNNINKNWYSLEILQEYQSLQKKNNFIFQNIINVIYSLFKIESNNIKFLRNIGFKIIEQNFLFKIIMLNYVLGLPVI